MTETNQTQSPTSTPEIQKAADQLTRTLTLLIVQAIAWALYRKGGAPGWLALALARWHVSLGREPS